MGDTTVEKRSALPSPFQSFLDASSFSSEILQKPLEKSAKNGERSDYSNGHTSGLVFAALAAVVRWCFLPCWVVPTYRQTVLVPKFLPSYYCSLHYVSAKNEQAKTRTLLNIMSTNRGRAGSNVFNRTQTRPFTCLILACSILMFLSNFSSLFWQSRDHSVQMRKVDKHFFFDLLPSFDVDIASKRTKNYTYSSPSISGGTSMFADIMDRVLLTRYLVDRFAYTSFIQFGCQMSHVYQVLNNAFSHSLIVPCMLKCHKGDMCITRHFTPYQY